jgi:hypothetical protein
MGCGLEVVILNRIFPALTSGDEIKNWWFYIQRNFLASPDHRYTKMDQTFISDVDSDLRWPFDRRLVKGGFKFFFGKEINFFPIA